MENSQKIKDALKYHIDENRTDTIIYRYLRQFDRNEVSSEIRLPSFLGKIDPHLQKVLGYCLLDNNPEHIIIFLVGKPENTSKLRQYLELALDGDSQAWPQEFFDASKRFLTMDELVKFAGKYTITSKVDNSVNWHKYLIFSYLRNAKLIFECESVPVQLREFQRRVIDVPDLGTEYPDLLLDLICYAIDGCEKYLAEGFTNRMIN